MRDFHPEPPVKQADEKPWVLGLLIGCIAVLFIIGIRLAYDNANDTAAIAANPTTTVSAPSAAASASKPAETTGSGSAAPQSSGGNHRNTGAMPKDQDVNQNGDQVPGGTK